MKLLSYQINSISEIFRDIGQVCFATLIVSPLVSGAINWLVIGSGLLFTLLAWFGSIRLARKHE